MGGTQTALSGDIPMFYWNPAGLASLEHPGFLASYSPSQENTDGFTAAYGQPLGPVTLTAGWIQSRTRNIETTDSLGTVLGEKDFINQQASLSLASDRFYFPLGVTVKYLESKFTPFDIHGAGVDLGLGARWNAFRFGAKWQDVGGTRLSGDSYNGGTAKELVPSRVRAGFAATNEQAESSKGERVARRGPLPLVGTLAVDLLSPLNARWGNMTAYYGGELWYEQRFGVRTGWNKDQGLSFGASLALSWLRLDYAFLINENFNPTNRITTVVYFGGNP
jgi:hypothetical protein